MSSRQNSLNIVYVTGNNTTSSLGFEKFDDLHVEEMQRLFMLARDLTGEHFRMGMEEANRMPYEVRTLTHLDQGEIRDNGDILAAIVRYQYQEPRFGRRRDLYRVNLQDHNILNKLRCEAGLVRFSPLLLYVLTHEIVHIVRFVKFLAPFHLEPSGRNQEERRVHALTQRILLKFPLKGLQEVLDKYKPLACKQVAI